MLAVYEMAVRDRVSEDVEVVFIFEDRFDVLSDPYVDDGVTNHAGIATC